MCVDSVLFELMLLYKKKPIICQLLIWHVLGPLKTFISARVRARLCVCQNEGECMRERERERERERAIHVLLIHSNFVVDFILFFFLYFTYSISILDSLQNLRHQQ